MSEFRQFPFASYIEGKDTPPDIAPQVFFKLVSSTAALLDGTGFLTGAPISQYGIHALEETHQAAARINPWIYNPGTQETNMLVARYCQAFGKRYNLQGGHLNIDLIEAGGHAHDLGRWFSHRRRVNDVAGTAIMDFVGFHPNFTHHLPSDNHWMPVTATGRWPSRIDTIDNSATLANYADITEYAQDPVKGLIEISDILGKFVGDGRPIKWSEVEEVSLRSRLVLPDQTKCGPAEFIRMTSAVNNIEGVVRFYQNLGKWVEAQIGVPIERVVEDVEEDLVRTPLPRTYNQKINQLKFDTMICDYGGVIGFGGATQDDGPLLRAVTDCFPAERSAEVLEDFQTLLNRCGMGLTGTEIDKILIGKYGTPLRELSVDNILYEDAKSFWVEMDTIRALKYQQNEGMHIILASNTEASGWRAITEGLKAAGLKHEPVLGETVGEMRANYLRIAATGVVPAFLSFNMHTRKSGSGGLTLREDQLHFYQLIDAVTQVDKAKTAVWDDRPKYMQAAADLGHPVFHTPEPAKAWEAVDKSFSPIN